jgi:hypothetical protein
VISIKVRHLIYLSITGLLKILITNHISQNMGLSNFSSHNPLPGGISTTKPPLMDMSLRVRECQLL